MGRAQPQGAAGRSIVERLIVRFPALFRALTRFTLARPPSPWRERMVRRFIDDVYHAYNRSDFELNTVFFDPARYEFRPGDIAGFLPDGRDVYRGKEGYVEACEQFLEVWDEVRVELLEIEDATPSRVVTLARFLASGAGSGIELSQPTLSVFELEDGLVIRQTFWLDVAAGRRALRDV